jgi:hypothetical protein
VSEAAARRRNHSFHVRGGNPSIRINVVLPSKRSWKQRNYRDDSYIANKGNRPTRSTGARESRPVGTTGINCRLTASGIAMERITPRSAAVTSAGTAAGVMNSLKLELTDQTNQFQDQVQILSPRVNETNIPSDSMSKGFLISGTRLTPSSEQLLTVFEADRQR